MVDDQRNTFTPQILQSIKKNHEHRISRMLSQNSSKNDQQDSDFEILLRVRSGQQLLSILTSVDVYMFDSDEPTDKHEMEMLSTFCDNAQELGDFSADFTAGDRIATGFSLNKMIAELEEAGFYLFGKQTYRFVPELSRSERMRVAVIKVARKTEYEEQFKELENLLSQLNKETSESEDKSSA